MSNSNNNARTVAVAAAGSAAPVETTHEEAMKKLLASAGKYADLILRGNDGVEVPANRCLLAARSDVFDGMLYRGFAEESKGVIELPFSGAVLNLLVEYIYTDKFEESVDVGEKFQEEFAANLIGLMNAGDYFGLEVLVQKVTTVAKSLMTSNPKTAMFCFRFCCLESARDIIYDCFRTNPTEALLHNSAIAMLSESQIRKLVGDSDLLNVDELTLFHIINTWSLGDSRYTESNNGGGSDRRRYATELADCLVLERIDPEALSTCVECSGIIPQQRIYEAFRSQALMAVRRHGVSYEKHKMLPWMGRSSPFTTFLLNIPPMRTGIHSWKVMVEKICNFTWIGVASTEHVVDPGRWLGCQDGVGWVYGSNGSACTSQVGEEGPYDVCHPTFDAGDIITFKLDLSNDNDNGTLSASVNQGESVVLFTEIKKKFQNNGSSSVVGLVPAASLCDPGCVRFLGFLKNSPKNIEESHQE